MARRTTSGDGPIPIAYVMTHYPYPSQTFLMEEVLGVSGDQFTIVPIAINPVGPQDILTEQHRIEQERTFYVKGVGKAALLTTIAKLSAKHPVRMAKLMARTVRSAGANVKLAAWRLFHLAEGIVVWGHCRDLGVRHIHAQFGGLPAAVAMYAAEFAREVAGVEATWSYTVHGFHDFVNENEIRLDLKTHSAAFVVGISDYTTSQLKRIADPNDWPKIRGVRCGIDLTRFPRRESAPDREIPTVVTVGRLSAEKGHIILLQAMHTLAQRGILLNLRLIGSGPYQAEIEAEIGRLGLTDRVNLLGMQPSEVVVDELRAADVFCLPSFAEGVPISIMEAMAMGVPVVSTNVGGIPELLTHGVTGWCTAPGRSDELAEALRAAVTGGAARDTVLDSARRRVEQLHDTQRASLEMRELFAEVTRLP